MDASETEANVTVSLTLTRLEARAWLGRLMSEASEECYCAGWLHGCEDDIPYACRQLSVGTYEGDLRMWRLISPFNARLMVIIAESLGHWVDHNGRPYTPKPSYLEEDR